LIIGIHQEANGLEIDREKSKYNFKSQNHILRNGTIAKISELISCFPVYCPYSIIGQHSCYEEKWGLNKKITSWYDMSVLSRQAKRTKS
jgi:hypothetical protein